MLEAELDPARDVDWDEAIAAAEPVGLRPGRGDRPALHPLHVRDDRAAEGHRARQRRARRRARVDDEERLRRRARRGVLGRLRRRLGRRPLLHRLRAALPRLHDRALRGQAGRDARCGRVLARHRPARRLHAVHRADGLPRDPPAGPRRQPHRPLRPLRLPHALPRGRALRPRDARLGGGAARRAGDRPLVADRDRLADRRQLPRHRAAARRPRLADAARARLGSARARRRAATSCRRGEIGALVVKLPMPPGSSPTLWNADERFREAYLSAFPGYYQTADAGYVDEDGYVFVMARTDDIINVAGHRLSTGAMEEVLAVASGRGRVRGDRRRRRAQGPAAGRLPRPQGRRRAAARRDRRASSCSSCASASARSRRSRPRPSSSACPRRARERSCAGRCAGSRTARSTRPRRRSTTRPPRRDHAALADSVTPARRPQTCAKPEPAGKREQGGQASPGSRKR